MTVIDPAAMARCKVPDHPLRVGLTHEVHARPHEQLKPPMRATHLAVASGEGGMAADRALLDSLCRHLGAEPPPAGGAPYFSGTVGPLRVRWERHSEFSTFTLFRFDAFEAPFTETALDLVPPGWLAEMPERVLVALHLAVETAERSSEELAALFGGNQPAGSRMLGGAAQAWADFRIHDGFGRMLVRDLSMTAGQGGRLTQRLLEIETYRMMALLAFPVAREIAPKLTRIDTALAGIVAGMASADDGAKDRELLDQLIALAAEAERLNAETSYRLSASRAYHAIVRQRIDELREDRIVGTQTVAEFMDRRLAPAMKTCEATAERQDSLARRIARASDLLRTRVDIALEEKNRDLLKSMNHRADLQLRLQETVEGLSVVAISYYLVGLVAYAAKGAKAAHMPVDPDVAALISVPVVLAMVAVGVRRLRKALVKHADD